MAKHKNCGIESAHRPHNINVGWQFSCYERCEGIMSVEEIRRAEIRRAEIRSTRKAIKDSKKSVRHERKMNRLRQKATA